MSDLILDRSAFSWQMPEPCGATVNPDLHVHTPPYLLCSLMLTVLIYCHNPCQCVYSLDAVGPKIWKHAQYTQHIITLALISFLLSQTPWCPWSRKCNYTLLCTPRACFSARIHGPKTRLPGVLHCTSADPQSHPEETKVIFTGATMYDDADGESLLPDRSPSPPPGNQHRSCFQLFGKDTH